LLLERHGQAVTVLAREHPVLGLALTTHRSTRGGPISFANRPYLVELYADARDMRDAVFSKAVQTGISEWMIQVMFDAAGWRGRIVAYVLPNYTVRNRFVQARIDNLLAAVPAYRDRCPGGPIGEAQRGAANLALKRFGRGAIMFLGSETPTDFVEFSADMLIVDELDSGNAANIALAQDRLRESPYPQRIYCGNPTRPRVGIARELDDSDHRRWHHRCDHCNERQPLDWFRNVVERNDAGRWVARDRRPRGRVCPVCRRCARPFERQAQGGLWVPSRDHPRRGYHLSRLDVLSEDLRKLVGEWVRAQGTPELVQAFHTSVLGLPFEFDGARLTVEQLEVATRDQPDTDRDGGDAYVSQVVVAGVDVGAVLHVTVSVVERDGEDRPVRRGRLVCTCRTFEEVADVFRRFRVDVAVVDAMPELHKSQELRDLFVDEGGTVVWLCRFHPTPRVGSQKYGMRLDYQTQLVQVDRTSVFDVSHEDIVDGRRTFPGDVWSVPGWSEQMRAPVRVVDDERGRIVWTEGGADDHHRLADVYERVAADLLDLGGQYFGG
jgi:hypothetical protein